MKILSTILVFLTLLLVVSAGAPPQRADELNVLRDNLVSSIQAAKPDWEYHQVSPIEGSGDVILQQWTLDSQSIRIAIVSHRSAAEASKQLVTLISNGRGQQVRDGVWDEAVAWGQNTISFRRQNLTIDVSAVNTIPTVSVTEVSNRAEDERKLCREFAKIVSEAVKDHR